MKTKDIQEIENKCIELIKNNDLMSFRYNYNVLRHQYCNVKTTLMPFIKACELMILLSTDFVEYLFFLETLDYEDVNSQHIKFVLRIEQLMAREDTEAIEKELGKYNEWDFCIRNIIKKLKNATDVPEIERSVFASKQKEDAVTIIQNCILFSKNFNKI